MVMRLQHTFTSQKQLVTNIASKYQHVNLFNPTGTLAKILDKQVSHMNLPVLSNPSSSAKMITSEENQKKTKRKGKENNHIKIKRKLNDMERKR